MDTRLLRHYALDTNAPLEEGPGGTALITLRPRAASREPRMLVVEIDRATGLVASMTARASTGDRTAYRILATRFDQTTEPGEFRLRRPQGAEVIEGGPTR